MFPILYTTVTEGVVPADYGVGTLTDCIRCEVTEERNGGYELVLEYAASGIHAEDITVESIIKAKPNFTDDPQLFRVYKVGKVMAGKFTVNAHHISYDLSGKIIKTGSAGTCVAACNLLDAQAGNFNITTDKSTTAQFTVSQPASVRSWFGGKQGSLLDVYGGEWKYDNYTASLLQARGTNRGVTIRYGKNLTELSQEISTSNLVTGIIPFYIDPDGNKTIGARVSTDLQLNHTQDVAIDFSSDIDPESSTSINTQLANLATKYKNNNNLAVPINSITLNFVQMKNLTERVDLCDTVNIYFEALGIEGTAKCIKTVWDVLKERYTSTTFGDSKTNIADTLVTQQKELANTPSTSFMSEAIARATELITGNLGGYVVLHDSDGNGEPDEILIMNTPNITTATKVWRWNQNGLGYSSTGYSGSYGTAITANGQIVADYIATGTLDASRITVTHLSASSIDTGTLNANLIKAGVISDLAGKFSLDMTTGEAIMRDFKSKSSFSLINDSNVTKAYFSISQQVGTYLRLTSANSAAVLVDLSANDLNASGVLSLNHRNGTTLVYLAGSENTGGHLLLRNVENKITGGLDTGRGTTHDGLMYLNNASGTTTINCTGQTGNITCVSVTQTSSRKVKENIKSIEDSQKILELDAVSFDYKEKAQGTDKRGFIAEEVQKVLPNLVTPETDNTPATLDYIGMIPYLQDVLKAQAAEIKELKAELAEIKNKVGG